MFERLEPRRLLTLAFQTQTTELSQPPDAYVFANVNNDDIADLVATGQDSEVYIGKGNHEYEDPIAFSLSGRTKIVAANIDADGQDELLFLGPEDIAIVDVVMEGVFEEITTLPGASTDAKLVDVNSDGVLDLVSVAFSTFRVATGDGTGQFSDWISYTFSNAPSNLDDGTIQIHDFNQDSHVDIVATNQDAAYTYLNSGDGFFELSSTFIFQQPITIQTLADVNGDGILDLVGNEHWDTISDATATQISYWPGSADGSFGPILPAASASGRILDIQSGDVNKDGLRDLVVSFTIIFHDTNSTGLDVLVGDATGFGIPQRLNDSRPDSIQLNDIDNDGSRDLTSLSGGSISAYTFTESRVFGELTNLATIDPSVFHFDVDADGNKERISYNADSSELEVATEGALLQTIPWDAMPNLYSEADVNGDGREDLLVLAQGIQPQIAILFVDETGQLGTPVVTVQEEFFLRSWFVDLNGDAIPDLIQQDLTFSFRIRYGQTDGRFSSQAQTITNAVFGIIEPKFLDLNDDGLLEIFATDPRFGSTTIHTQRANGSYTPIASGGSRGAADINGDGKLDMVVLDGQAMSIGLGDGALNFDLQRLNDETGRLLSAEDLNTDGFGDVIVTNGDEVSVYYGGVDGLALRTQYDALRPLGFVAADFSGDGHVDYLTYNKFQSGRVRSPNQPGFLTLAIGSPDGSVTDVVHYSTSLDDISSITVADWNSDGKLDLEIVANLTTGSLPNIFMTHQLIGDFDQDGQLDAGDIDLLCSQIGGDDELFDVNNDSLVDSGDVSHLVESIMGTSLGDTNLDGEVAFDDFLILSANFGSNGAGWSQGDFDCDGEVGFSDFLILSSRFGA